MCVQDRVQRDAGGVVRWQVSGAVEEGDSGCEKAMESLRREVQSR